MPATSRILQQFERSLTASVNASDLKWSPGYHPAWFAIVGHPLSFHYHRDIRHAGVVTAWVFRDDRGWEVVVDNA